jgi:O-acetyl-ADP-ribose deacetylase (regulator of RNase III)
MPITLTAGNILAATTDAIVNPVNTDGVMGKGLALQFKKAFPKNFVAYAHACDAGELVVGRMHVFERAEGAPRFIINFPTKKHWRHPSKLEYVRDGLADLVLQVKQRGIVSIAIPPLGCGLGGLAWVDVEPLIVDAFAGSDVSVVLFAPTA